MADPAPQDDEAGKETAELRLPKALVLVGLMGAGKSCIGRRLSEALELPFVDADTEIEAAAGCTIQEIFERHGEAAFRDGERRVIERLLNGKIQILATGGGAFMDPRTRETIRQHANSLWLRADLDLLVKRTSRRNHRPLLHQGNPRQILGDLIDKRYPVYGEADVIIDSVDGPVETTVQRALDAITAFLSNQGEAREDTNSLRKAGE
ncbi:shikimate kinase [Pelagibius sp. Alg239-R121]|uniref:shikimate kinase n=1 Tax=Pelagibius sp. Alg239-R121 TaxID=2993448 RepID=UPI002AC32BC2|nr:shikimate kinase [Pelagibius sp. Alg239-R121]